MNAQLQSSSINLDKAIRKEHAPSGQFLVWGLRDLPGKPLMGGPYMAARVYDEYTADILVAALRNAAKLMLHPTVSTLTICNIPPVPRKERLPMSKRALTPLNARKRKGKKK